jgi:uncharacterized phiE125 gp8 family phage protein
MGLVLTTPPAAEPVTLAISKNHLRIDSDLSADDALITSLLVAAREEAEAYTGASIVNQTWTATFDGFPCWRDSIRLARGPVRSITSISYVDPSGATQTLSSSLYTLNSRERSDVVGIKAQNYWPATADQEDAVTVVYQSGYGLPSDNPVLIPQGFVAAILLLVGDLYRNREAQIIERAVAITNERVASLLNELARTPVLG